HAYARNRGMDFDLVFMEERGTQAAEKLKADLAGGPAKERLGKPGGVFVLDSSAMPAEARTLFEATARVVLDRMPGAAAPRGVTPVEPSGRGGRATPGAKARGVPPKPPHRHDLQFWNGFGGFSADGREYVVVVDGMAPGGPRLPPAPWINVLANPVFGCL